MEITLVCLDISLICSSYVDVWCILKCIEECERLYRVWTKFVDEIKKLSLNIKRWYFVSACTHADFEQDCCNLHSLWTSKILWRSLCLFRKWLRHFERWLLNITWCLYVEHSPNSLYHLPFCVHSWVQTLPYITQIYLHSQPLRNWRCVYTGFVTICSNPNFAPTNIVLIIFSLCIWANT